MYGIKGNPERAGDIPKMRNCRKEAEWVREGELGGCVSSVTFFARHFAPKSKIIRNFRLKQGGVFPKVCTDILYYAELRPKRTVAYRAK